MKRDKKALYEQIMASVAREVKKALNEQEAEYKEELPVSKTEVIEMIKNTDWAERIDNHDYDYSCNMYGGEIFAIIPDLEKYDNYFLQFNIQYSWKHIPYDPGTYWQPPSGGYYELKNVKIDKVLIYRENSFVIDLTKELKEFAYDNFSELFNKVADDVYDEDNYEEDYYEE